MMSFTDWLRDQWRDGKQQQVVRNFRFEIQTENKAGDISGRVLVRRSDEWVTCAVVQLLAPEWVLLKLVLDEYDVEVVTRASTTSAVPAHAAEDQAV